MSSQMVLWIAIEGSVYNNKCPWHFANFKISWKSMTLVTNLVFTNVFNLQGDKPTTLQALSHSLWPLPLFFV
jgi:hypothetical protein